MGDKLDLVWIIYILYRGFGVVHHASLCDSHFSFLVIFGAFSVEIRRRIWRSFLYDFVEGFTH